MDIWNCLNIFVSLFKELLSDCYFRYFPCFWFSDLRFVWLLNEQASTNLASDENISDLLCKSSKTACKCRQMQMFSFLAKEVLVFFPGDQGSDGVLYQFIPVHEYTKIICILECWL